MKLVLRSPGRLPGSSIPMITLCLLVLNCPNLALAEAFRILDQSARATGQGTAFAAQADDASAVHFNPAAMVRLPGIQTTMGLLLIGGEITFQPTAGNIIHGNFGGPIANPPPSHLFLTANLANVGFSSLRRVAIGIGINSPFGNLTHYPNDTPLSSVITAAAFPLVDVKPTVAFELNEFICMGLGLDIYTFSGLFGEGQVELQQDGFDLTATGIAEAGDEVELNGTDTAVGYNLSFLLTPWRNQRGDPLVNIAFVYRSHTELHLKGSLINHTQGTSLRAKTALNLPQIVTVGLGVWPVRTPHREWKVEIDLDYADWTSLNNLDVTLSNGLVIPKPKNWQSALTLMLGTEYKFLHTPLLSDWEIALRSGYVLAESPVPDRTFSPDVPDADYQAFSIGLGLLCRDKGMFLGLITCGNQYSAGLEITAVGLDLAYQTLLYRSRGIHNNVDPLGRVEGTWNTIIHVGALSLHLKFDTGL